jgi:hypothetical protein
VTKIIRIDMSSYLSSLPQTLARDCPNMGAEQRKRRLAVWGSCYYSVLGLGGSGQLVGW